MVTKPPNYATSNSQAREASPFFSLRNEDGSNPQPEHDSGQSLQYPPITLSCANCERIVGDSSAFFCATRQMGTITLGRMVSVTVGPGGLETSMEGEWDEFCNYKDITCGKCSTALGKMYFATTSKLSALQNKYTLDITTLSFYQHASNGPSLPVAVTSEIYGQLHPSPEALSVDINHIMTICVMLRDEQENIMRELRKLGQVTGVSIDLEDGGINGEGLEAKDSWREKAEEALGEIVERVKFLEGKVGEIGKRLGEEDRLEYETIAIRQERDAQVGQEALLKGGKKPWEKKQLDDIVRSDILPYPPPLGPRRQGKGPQKAPPPAVVNKRKRKLEIGNAPNTTDNKDTLYIDLSNTPEQDGESSTQPSRQPQNKRKSKKEVPNSQSADEAEKEESIDDEDGEYKEEQGEDGEEEEEEEEEEAIEDRIKSPAEKRRKAVAVPVVPKKGFPGRRVSQGRKMYK